jgi:hypothetical protein
LTSQPSSYAAPAYLIGAVDDRTLPGKAHTARITISQVFSLNAGQKLSWAYPQIYLLSLTGYLCLPASIN